MMFLNIVLIIILLFIAVYDALNYKILNETIAAIACLIIVKFLISTPEGDASKHLLYALLTSASVITLYSLGCFGGGDAKLLVVAFFWLSLDKWFSFLYTLMIITFIYSISLYIFIRFTSKVTSRTKIPYGPCISLAWIINLF